MAQHEMRAQIVVSGKEDGSLTQLGNKLQGMAMQIQGISNAAMDFMKESVDTYRSYEDGILETRSVLQSTYSSQLDLSRDMTKIEKAAQHWAETTIFTTDDVANSIANAAHAGWDYSKIIEGMPSAMLIAQAGHLELADGVDYLTKMMAATGTEFKDSEGFVNEWAKAADMAATDIDEIGQAFLKLGTASRLADTNEELFTFMSILANSGTTGSVAGTAIRNVMARIAAPTGKAEEAMLALGISEEEVSEALDDLNETSTEAYQRLSEMGFTAYDTEGKLRPFKDIFTDMNILLGDMDEKSRNDFLKQLFGTKSFAYAMTLLDAANDGSLTSIYEAILGVRDTDYAEEKAATVMSGLTGSVEIMNSKLEEFKRKIGEDTASPLESLIQSADYFLDGLNDANPAVISGIAKAISVIAVSAPALMGIGSVAKVIGSLGLGSGFAWMAAAAGIAGVATAVEKLTGIESNFGDVTLDNNKINDYLDSIVTPYSSHAEEMMQSIEAIESAKESYLDSLTGVQGLFKTDTLTGETVMNANARQQYENYGKQMYDSLMTGVQESKKEHIMFLNSLMDADNDGNISSDELDDDSYNMYSQLFDAEISLWESAEQNVTTAINDYYTAVETAATQGWSDETRAALKSAIDELDAAYKELAEYNADVDIARALHSAETVSWETINDTIASYEQARDSEIQAYSEEYYRELASQRAAYNKNNKTDLSMAEFLQTDEGKFLESQFSNAVGAKNKRWGGLIDDMVYQLLPEEYQQAFSFMNWLNGEEGVKYYDEGLLGEDYVSRFGNQLAAAYYKSNGFDLYNVDDPNGLYNRALQLVNSDIGQALLGTGNYDFTRIGEVLAAARNRTYDDTGWVGDTTLAGAITAQTGFSGLENFANGLSTAFAFTKNGIGEVVGRLSQIMSGLGDKASGVAGSFGQSILSALPGINAFFANGAAPVSSFNGIDPQSRSVSFIDNGTAAAVEANARSLFGSEITQDVSVTDNGAASSLRSSIESQFSSPITQQVNVQKTGAGFLSAFAEGGRATEASIFGEAGAEWAIPEQHTERTAELLTKAAAASGFSWGELLTRNGGLNAGSSGSTTIVYSPTINAGGSDGVEKALINDKARFDKFLRERNMINASTAYA